MYICYALLYYIQRDAIEWGKKLKYQWDDVKKEENKREKKAKK